MQMTCDDPRRKKIRTSPAAQITPLLKQVFGKS
jgi:hypothetical protein